MTQLALEHGLSPRGTAIVAATSQPTVYTAVNVNGDSVLSTWLNLATDQLKPTIADITTSVNRVVLDALGASMTLQRLAGAGTLSRQQSAALLRELKRLSLAKRLVVALRPHIGTLTNTFASVSNHAFVASSTRIVEGLSQQIMADEDLPDLPVQFEMTSSDAVSSDSLTIEGIPVKIYLELLVASIYTEPWLVSLINRAFQAAPTFDRAMAMVTGVGTSRAGALLDRLKTAAFYVLHEASLRAAGQLSTMEVMYDDIPHS